MKTARQGLPISSRLLLTNICKVAAALFLSITMSINAADLVEEFDGAELNPDVWEATGAKSINIADSRLTWNDDGGNWAAGDISSVQQFFLPAPGETTEIIWTLGPGSITSENTASNGRSIRYQIGIHSANETATRKEHWANTTGGVWIDLDNIAPSNSTGMIGGLYSTNDTKQAQSQGASVGAASIENWNWQTDTHLFRLELTDTEFTWFNGDEVMGGDTWQARGIDTEFSNGYRVLAIGQNFDSGRGFTSVERIEVKNAGSPSSLITSFSASPLTAISGQDVTFAWKIDAEAEVSIDQGVGMVDAFTVDGSGQLQITAAEVSISTPIAYTLIVVKNGVQDSRTLTLNVSPAPELVFDNFQDEFDGDTLNSENWEHRGERSYTLSEGRINWDANANNWGHGEINSRNVFPMPSPGNTTTITWVLGPAQGTVEADNGNSLRPMLGIFSSFENHSWSRQHWQNTTGGIWLDVTAMGNNRTDGVSGNLIESNDTKALNSNGTTIDNFDVPDWNWQTDSHQFSLVIDEINYSWFSGESLLGTGNLEAAGIDAEFAGGFKIMMMAGNWNQGRGPMSLELVDLQNGAVPSFFKISGISEEIGGFQLTWQANLGKIYQIHRKEGLDLPWSMIGEVAAQSEIESFTDTTAPTNRAFYTVANIPTPPVFIEDFEDGSAGWTTGSLNANSSTQWELGTPATGQGPGSAFSGSKAYGTNLDSDYEFNTNIFLRSPVIDLTGICQATLTYQGYQDMEPLIDGLFFDFMEIRILDLNGQGIQNSSVRKRAGSTDGWRKEKLRLPSEVLDRRIMIEFSFHSDDFNAIDDESFEEFTQAGWFIDDVTIVPE